MRCVVVLLVLAACDAGQRAPAGPRPDQLAQAEIDKAQLRAQHELDAVAKAVLERFVLDPQTVPDSGLLHEEKTIFIDRELAWDGTGGLFSSDALPSGAFSLRASADMQADADRTDQHVHYIFIKSLQIEGDRATFWVGVQLKIPNRPEGPGECCCSAEQVYVKRGGRWTYADTTSSVCS